MLDLADQLILCSDTTAPALDAAERLLRRLRGSGRQHLADDAAIVITEISRSPGRSFPIGLHGQLGVPADQVIAVPFDPSLHFPGFRELRSLRTPTLSAFLDLAELVVRPETP
ncbi:hypothetical protein AB0I06_08275 [Streptomyces sp. NPDC050674]|uniref:hypothetical protein n=1 Tax=Streptomyces sp. NPDC050674 TaxID=3157216 RepID=UPI003418391E